MANVFASVVNFNDVMLVKVSYPDGSVVPVDVYVRCLPAIDEVLGASSAKRCTSVKNSFYDWLNDAFEQAQKDCYPINGSFVVSNQKTGQIRVFVANSGDAVHEQLVAGRVLEIVDSATEDNINRIAKEKAERHQMQHLYWKAFHTNAANDPLYHEKAWEQLPMFDFKTIEYPEISRETRPSVIDPSLRNELTQITWKDGTKTDVIWED